MQVQRIQNRHNCSTNFAGKLVPTKALQEFEAGLNNVQKDIFKKNIARMEKECDGRIFKYDYCDDGTVGIFEKNNIHPEAKEWIMLFQSSIKERAAWCFDELNKIYRYIILTKPF